MQNTQPQNIWRAILEFEAGHVPGAHSVPLSQLDEFISTLKKDLAIVVYCRGAYCVLAYDAVKTLNKKGFDAPRLQEGMFIEGAKRSTMEALTDATLTAELLSVALANLQ